MTNSGERFRITRVGHRSPEAEFWMNQLNEYVLPFVEQDMKPRRKFGLPDDTIILVAEDMSQPGTDCKGKAVGSVAIKRQLPGDEQSEGLPTIYWVRGFVHFLFVFMNS